MQLALRNHSQRSAFRTGPGVSGVGILTAGLAVTPWVAALEPTCPIVLDNTAAEGWPQAVSEAAARLRELAATNPVDCRSIEVHPNRQPPEVVLITVDGRLAVRAIAGPDELGATIDALALTFSAVGRFPSEGEASPGKGEPQPTEQAAASGLPKKPPETFAAPPQPASTIERGLTAASAAPMVPGTLLALSGHVGLRTGDGKAAPELVAQGSVMSDPWEVRVSAQWETRYIGISDEIEDGISASGVSIRVDAGVRRAIAPLVAVSAGLGIGVAGLELQAVDGVRQIPVDDVLEVRPGVFGGVRFPAQGSVGLRCDLLGDWVPQALETNSRSGLPRYAITGTLGIEAQVL